MIISEEVPSGNEGEHSEKISQEEATKATRYWLEKLGLIVGFKNRMCPRCGRIVPRVEWEAHQRGHENHDRRRREDAKW